MNRVLRILPRVTVAVLALALVAHPATAQTFPGTDVASQNLRAYHFVFAAYAVAWVLVFGWVVAVARRLARLEKRLDG